MVLDAATVRNLELVEPLFAGERRDSTLIHVLDKTATGMGGRLLRQRLLHPSCRSRGNRIAAGCRAGTRGKGHSAHRSAENAWSGFSTWSVCLPRSRWATAGPRDLLALGRSLAKASGDCQADGRSSTRPRLAARIRRGRRCARPDSAGDRGRAARESRRRRHHSRRVRCGARRTARHQPEQPAVHRRHRNARARRDRHPVAESPLQQRFRLLHRDLESQICTWFPPRYERKQTLANAERFTTPELKELEAKVLAAEEKILELERTLFQEVRGVRRMRRPNESSAAAAVVAELDVCRDAWRRWRSRTAIRRPRFSDSAAKCGSKPAGIR